ncbi:MAG: 3-deoxy-D-manno-octulosonic acid transferase [Deltaproteobacteria bacterium]|nr:3-deoxy-D-manno-octulosonic acid transferase [Deltaproteobacteria bacterium]
MAKPFLPGSAVHAAYNAVLAAGLVLGAPAWLPYALSAAKRRRNFLDRLGVRMDRIPAASGRPRVWIHAVSVGETLSVAALTRQLKRRDPSVDLLLSTVTITGQEAAGKVLGNRIDGRFYFPFDLPPLCGRFLDRVRPDAVAMIETEIWPNFLAECARRGIPAVLLNGRISDRSFRRYMRFRFLFGPVLRCLSVIAAQTEEDARRFRAIGADAAAVAALGNIKFDVAPPPSDEPSPFLAWLKDRKRAGDLWFVAGSTHEGEEEAVLAALFAARSRNGRVRLLLAPRHPERFDAVEGLCVRAGWGVQRKSRLSGDGDESPIVLLDTVGELLSAYAAADVAFVGGSLVPKGGHNILEPALHAVPTVIGPHTRNFQEIVSLFATAGAVAVAKDGEELAARIADWAEDPDRYAPMGRKGRELLDAFRGAAERSAGIVLSMLRRKAAAP